MRKKIRALIIIVVALVIMLPAYVFAANSNIDSSTKNFLSDLSLVAWLYGVIVAIFFSTLAVILFLAWFFRKELRLYKNLKRPIMIITPTDSKGKKIAGKEMEVEIEMLKKNNLFNVYTGSHNFQSLNPKENYCLIVVGYDKNMAGLDDILSKVKSLHIPLIFYTYGENIGAIDDEIKKKITQYPLHLCANFKLTLLNHIFTTLSTYPYEKK